MIEPSRLISPVAPIVCVVGILWSVLFVLSVDAQTDELGGPSSERQLPTVLIFNGLPGDEEHHHFYEKNLRDIREAFLGRYGIPEKRVSVFYGPKESGYDGVASRENVLSALEAVIEQASAEPAGRRSPVWLIFQGHANRIPGGANLNLPGPDLSTRELGRAMKGFPEDTPIVVIATTAAASDFLKSLSGKGRIIIAASVSRDPVTETEFPMALSAALASEETDTNQDGKVTALELFEATKLRVIQIYEKGGYMIREHTQLDGDGDAKGTQRPADVDADPAKLVSLFVPKQSKFE